MKLLVDIGNTRLKSALLHQGELVQHRSLNWHGDALDSRIAELWRDCLPTDVAISSVAAEEVVEIVFAHARDHWSINPKVAKYHGDCFGLRCGYDQPESLGIDRWLAMLGAWGRRGGSWLVADLGTAATLDVIDRHGQHLGGCIFAGIETQREALLQQTAALPKVDRENSAVLARETQGGIALGTLLSVVGAVRELYEDAQNWPGCEGINLCLTGGAAGLAADRLALGQLLCPHLVLEGLAMNEFNVQISVHQPIAKSP